MCISLFYRAGRPTHVSTFELWWIPSSYVAVRSGGLEEWGETQSGNHWDTRDICLNLHDMVKAAVCRKDKTHDLQKPSYVSEVDEIGQGDTKIQVEHPTTLVGFHYLKMITTHNP